MSCSWCQQSHCGAVTVFPFLVDKYLGEGTVKLLRPIILACAYFSLLNESYLQQSVLWCWPNDYCLLPSLCVY